MRVPVDSMSEGYLSAVIKANPKAGSNIESVFGSFAAQSVARQIVKSQENHDDTNFFATLDEGERAYLAIKIRPLLEHEKIGKKQAKAALNLARLMIVLKRNSVLINDDISNFDTIRTAYDDFKNRFERDIFLKSASRGASELDFRQIIHAGGNEYLVAFEPRNIELQNVALEKVKSCFSEGSANSKFARQYQSMGNVFFVPIINLEKESIVGRFTLGFGRREIEDGDDNLVVRISKLHLDYDEEASLGLFDIDRVVSRYASAVGKEHLEHGRFFIRIPKGPGIFSPQGVYDDYFPFTNQNQIKISRGEVFEIKYLEREIFKAVDAKDEAQFMRIVGSGAYDPNGADSSGTPLIFRVIESSNEDMLRTLLADPNLVVNGVRMDNGNNIIHHMTKQLYGGSLLGAFATSSKFSKEMLSETNDDGKSPLDIAVGMPNPEFARILLGLNPYVKGLDRMICNLIEDRNKLLDILAKDISQMDRMNSPMGTEELSGRYACINEYDQMIEVLEKKYMEMGKRAQVESEGAAFEGVLRNA